MFKKNSFLGWLFGNQESTKEEVKTPKAARTTTGVKELGNIRKSKIRVGLAPRAIEALTKSNSFTVKTLARVKRA